MPAKSLIFQAKLRKL